MDNSKIDGHWWWVAGFLDSATPLIGFLYKSAMAHGYKHRKEEEEERERQRRQAPTDEDKERGV